MKTISLKKYNFSIQIKVKFLINITACDGSSYKALVHLSLAFSPNRGSRPFPEYSESRSWRKAIERAEACVCVRVWGCQVLVLGSYKGWFGRAVGGREKTGVRACVWSVCISVKTHRASSAVQCHIVTLQYCNPAIPGRGESDRRRGHATLCEPEQHAWPPLTLFYQSEASVYTLKKSKKEFWSQAKIVQLQCGKLFLMWWVIPTMVAKLTNSFIERIYFSV